MERALSANLTLLGFDGGAAAAAAARGVDVTSTMFRKPNSKGLEELLFFLLTALDGHRAGRAFLGLWPIHDALQARALKKAATAWLHELVVKEGVLTKPLVTALVTAAGERVVELLWRVSVHVLGEAQDAADVNGDERLPRGCDASASASAAERVVDIDLAVSEARGRLHRLGAAAAAKQAEVALFAQRLAANHRQLTQRCTGTKQNAGNAAWEHLAAHTSVANAIAEVWEGLARERAALEVVAAEAARVTCGDSGGGSGSGSGTEDPLDAASVFPAETVAPAGVAVRHAAEMRRLQHALDPSRDILTAAAVAGFAVTSDSGVHGARARGGLNGASTRDPDVFREEAVAARVETELGSLVTRLRGVVRHLRREVDGVSRGIDLAGSGGGRGDATAVGSEGQSGGGGGVEATGAVMAGAEPSLRLHAHSELMPPTPLPRSVPVSTPSPAGPADPERRFGNFILD
jgi:hypothetical protein